MSLREWTTDAVGPRDQRSFWREAVCEAVLNVATEFPEEGFQGQIVCSEVGDLRFASFACAGHQILRQKSHIARSKDDHFLVSLQRRGTCHMFQEGLDCALSPGDVGLVDGTRPFRVRFPESVDRIVAVIPHDQLFSRAPWLRYRPLNRIARQDALGGALRFYLERLAGDECASAVEATFLAENVCNLIALMTASTEGEKSAALDHGAHLTLSQIIPVLRQHLADPDLSPRLLAERMRVSVRTIHKRFEEAQTTFGQWVLENRLQACRRALRDPGQARFTISEIAFGWGFNDLSHFSRAFKARFGETPSRFRETGHENR